jgi:hypothetical protein
LIPIGLVTVLLLALVASQLLLPGYLEHRLASRLTENGGSASVTLEALPAVRLLANDGDKLAIRGRNLGIHLELSELGSPILDKLDGFDQVDLRFTSTRAEPFQVQTFVLSKAEHAHRYRLEIRAATSSRALATYGSAQLPGLLGSLARGAAGAVLGDGQRIPVDITTDLISEGGRAPAGGARGTVAGLQVGPLVQLLTGSILSGL